MVFQFRSSPYGSVSHSHADQNSFVLYAYGDPLAISSGYYPWAGSPHHREWTNQTLSKNAVLIDGKGQSAFDIEATGRIEQFIHTEKYDYTAGEASSAYAKNGVKVDSYRRHVVFVRPDLFIVVDDIRTPEPSSITWLLHSAFPLTWDSESNRAHTSGSKGQLDAHLISGQVWSAAVSNEFVPPPEIQGVAPQWHLTLTSREKASGHRIVAVLVPNRAGESKRVELLDADVVETEDNLTVHLTYRKDREEVGATIEFDLTEEGVQAGPVIQTM